jgi:hypothetical protein
MRHFITLLLTLALASLFGCVKEPICQPLECRTYGRPMVVRNDLAPNFEGHKFIDFGEPGVPGESVNPDYWRTNTCDFEQDLLEQTEESQALFTLTVEDLIASPYRTWLGGDPNQHTICECRLDGTWVQRSAFAD